MNNYKKIVSVLYAMILIAFVFSYQNVSAGIKGDNYNNHCLYKNDSENKLAII